MPQASTEIAAVGVEPGTRTIDREQLVENLRRGVGRARLARAGKLKTRSRMSMPVIPSLATSTLFTWLLDVPRLHAVLGDAYCMDPQPAGCHIAVVVVTPTIEPGTTSDRFLDHYSLLRTTEDMLGLPPLGAAADANSMADSFGLG